MRVNPWLWNPAKFSHFSGNYLVLALGAVLYREGLGGLECSGFFLIQGTKKVYSMCVHYRQTVWLKRLLENAVLKSFASVLTIKWYHIDKQHNAYLWIVTHEIEKSLHKYHIPDETKLLQLLRGGKAGRNI